MCLLGLHRHHKTIFTWLILLVFVILIDIIRTPYQIHSCLLILVKLLVNLLKLSPFFRLLIAILLVIIKLVTVLMHLWQAVPLRLEGVLGRILLSHKWSTVATSLAADRTIVVIIVKSSIPRTRSPIVHAINVNYIVLNDASIPPRGKIVIIIHLVLQHLIRSGLPIFKVN